MHQLTKMKVLLVILATPRRKEEPRIKTIENMCSNIGARAESISAIVPKQEGLISVLSTADKELSDFQAKLYDEICKIDGLSGKEILDVIDIMVTHYDTLRVFFNYELKKDYNLRKIGRNS